MIWVNKRQYLTSKVRRSGNPWQVLKLAPFCVLIDSLNRDDWQISPLLFPTGMGSHGPESWVKPFFPLPWSITAGSAGRLSVGSAAASVQATLSWASSSKSGCVIPVTTPSKTRSECWRILALLCICSGKSLRKDLSIFLPICLSRSNSISSF